MKLLKKWQFNLHLEEGIMATTTKRAVTAEDLYDFKTVSCVRISPDGKRIIFPSQRVERKTEKKYTNLWILPTKPGAKAQQFTYGDQSDTSPSWSPDGSQIAFLSNRGDHEKLPQFYLIPGNGGEARQLTQIKGVITSFSWSPDGRQLLCQVIKTDKEVLEREEDEGKKKLGVVVRHYTRAFYKLDGIGYLPQERCHLWLVDAVSGKARQITDDPVFDELDAAWSPDGKWIVYLSNRSQDPDFNLEQIDLFVMPAKGGAARKITTEVGEKGLPVFSPDGKWIAYYGGLGEGEGWRNTYLWLTPVDGSQKPRNLTGRYDLHVSPWTINDMGEPELTPPTWSKDGQSIYFPVSYHGSSILDRIDLKGVYLETVIGEGGVVGSFNFDRDQKKLAYFYGNIGDPAQICVLDMPTHKSTLLHSHNQKLLAKLDLGSIEEVWFKGAAGNDLQGWILKPPAFDPEKKYPSILEIHGGPQTQYGNFFMHEFCYFASRGYVVYFCNPRGGRGYGEEHSKAIWGSWGQADYADLMAWTDYMEKKPYIDPKRMGVTGGSYGGYMTVWIIGHTQRFKAAVAQRCVSNFLSMWGSSDVNWVFQQELCARQPFFDFEKFWKMSPIAYIGNAKTPTKVIHNENDMRCPVEQGEQVFVALKSLGVDTEMVRFPDEFHGLSRTGRTDRRIARLDHIIGWFEKYLK
jgi:dipeptidyl aminopeptidase/acylaminoacyl peptidase